MNTMMIAFLGLVLGGLGGTLLFWLAFLVQERAQKVKVEVIPENLRQPPAGARVDLEKRGW